MPDLIIDIQTALREGVEDATSLRSLLERSLDTLTVLAYAHRNTPIDTADNPIRAELNKIIPPPVVMTPEQRASQAWAIRELVADQPLESNSNPV